MEVDTNATYIGAFMTFFKFSLLISTSLLLASQGCLAMDLDGSDDESIPLQIIKEKKKVRNECKVPLLTSNENDNTTISFFKNTRPYQENNFILEEKIHKIPLPKGIETKDDTIIHHFVESMILYEEGKFEEGKFGEEKGLFFEREGNNRLFLTQPYKPTPNPPQSNLIYNEGPQTLETILMRISNKDRRNPIKKTKKWPNRIHGQITMTYKGKNYGGSGILIGPHHFLTAGRNVYNDKFCNGEKWDWADSISVYLGLNENSAPFGKVRVVSAYTFKKWIDDKSKTYDMALLLLESSIGDEIGWGGFLSLNDQESLQEQVILRLSRRRP